MEAVSIVTIKRKISLFKNGELAERIELIELEETGFEVIALKTLYEVGDKAIYIQPDFNLPDTPLFEGFIKPMGDVSKSMLGKVGGVPSRVRAKKFNFSKSSFGDCVYSNGILLPIKEVKQYLIDFGLIHKLNQDWGNITELLGVTKHEDISETEGSVKDNSTKKERTFPEGVYKTDETNVNNLWGHLENIITYPVTLVGTEKIDGSSITIGITPEIPEGFICSRNMRKKLMINKIVGRRFPTLFEKIKMFFGVHVDLNIYTTEVNDDNFVKYGYPVLNSLIDNQDTNLIIRGELNGGSLKGSGNKNNPASLEKPNIKVFGVDITDNNGVAIKLPYSNVVGVCELLNLEMVKTVFVKSFNNKEELLQECNNYFKQNMIEGIVVRTLDSNFSCKVMNLEYDSKK